ncbi:DUF5906 domain-containing protein [Mycoplasma feriruminatoris]|uniref:DUF5906 domain-containing protein n=1 Tax=Mycoplasma feriruminatoris TaxID=1179777 RepID=UPI00241C118F|nr:DUF5906 domain-containing protein [Mycoplasma feriruminatoris]WFQ94774.1 hypothetical protein MFERI15220_00857 [Mycoplasma feriruminatoris]
MNNQDNNITILNEFKASLNILANKLSELAKNPRDEITRTNRQEIRNFSTIFNKVVDEVYPEIAENYLKSLNLCKIKDTELYGIYKDNYIEPLDIQILKETKNIEIQSQKYVASFKKPINEVLTAAIGVSVALNDYQMDKLWEVFSYAFWATINNNQIEIINSSDNKNYVVYAINDGYLKVFKDKIEFMPLYTSQPLPHHNNNINTLFKFNINFNDILLWNDLSINKDESNYSLFKHFITAKVVNIETLGAVLADLTQPLFNTQVMTLLIGGQGGGKSSFLNMLPKMIGQEFIGNVDLHSALINKFEQLPLFNKLIVTSSELSQTKMSESNVLKQLISREKTSLNLKFQSVKEARPIAKILIAGNQNFKATNNDGLNRRLCFIQFNNQKIRQDISILDFEKQLHTDIKGFVAYIILGAQYLLKNGWNYETFNNSSDKELLQEFSEQYNPLIAFINSMLSAGYLTIKKDEKMSLPELVAIAKLFKLAHFNTKNADDLEEILEQFNSKINPKSLSSKLVNSGVDTFVNQLNKTFATDDIKIGYQKITNERVYSNRDLRYQKTTLLTNLSLNWDNDEFKNIMANSSISFQDLEKEFGNVVKGLIYNDLTQRTDLIYLFDPLNPIIGSVNKNAWMDFDRNEYHLQHWTTSKIGY